jgi:pectate lyase
MPPQPLRPARLLLFNAVAIAAVLQACSADQGEPAEDGRGGTSTLGGAGGVAAAGGVGLGGASGVGGSMVSTGGINTGGSGVTGGLGGVSGAPAGGSGATVSGGSAGVAGSVTSGSGGMAGGATGGNSGSATGGAGAGGKGGTGGASGGAGTGGKGGSGGAGGGASCMTPPPADPVVGWASVNGMNQNGTTGGGTATPQVVTTLAAFTAAVAGTNAAVVYLNAVLPNGSVAIGSNKTIVGVCGAEFHGHLGFSRSANVIVRNLKIVGYGVGDCSKDPSFTATVGCSSGSDAISISTASHHVWFDHCDISDGTDGNLDINAGSDFITISWTKFHYTARTDNVGNDSTGANGHRYSNLIGSGDMVPEDVGHLNVTWHHNWWAENVNQRMPRTRRGKIHVVNNLYSSAGNSWCTNSGFETHLLVENNVYTGVRNPLSPDANGDMLARNNVFTNTTGTTTANGTGFTPPYTYAPEATGALEAAIRSGAGPH